MYNKNESFNNSIGEEHISLNQRKQIKNLVRDKSLEKNIHYSTIYSDLKKHLKKRSNISVKSYKDIPQSYFNEAVLFLKEY